MIRRLFTSTFQAGLCLAKQQGKYSAGMIDTTQDALRLPSIHLPLLYLSL